MKKIIHAGLLLGAITISILSCKKDFISEPGNKKFLNEEIELDRYTQIWSNAKSIRNSNPYSMSTMRKVRALLSNSNDEEIKAIGEKELSTDNIQYYYKIPLNTNDNRSALQDWLAADESRSVFDFPIDSVSLHPDDFEGKLNGIYQTDHAYTNTFSNDPLPSSITATIIDTLYIPNSQSSSDELFLDVVANVLTANIGAQYLQLFDESDPGLVDDIEEIYDMVTMSGSTDMLHFNPDHEDIGLVFQGTIDEIIGSIKGWSRNPPSLNDRGSIAFWETERQQFEGVRNVRIKLVHFTGLTHTAHMYNTDETGNFNIGWLLPGSGTFVIEFANNKTKVIDADIKNFGSGVWSVLNLPYAARDVRFYWYSQPGDKTIRYAHGTKSALWGMIMNGIREANQYAVDESLRSNVNNSPFLTVYGVYSGARLAMGTGSAPMFAHTGASSGGLNWLYSLFSLVGTAPHVISNNPDLLISQSQDNPFASSALRQTIYHEYGHSLHYFKAGDLFWSDNVLKTIGQNGAPPNEGYGAAINTQPGDFFSLTEGWADYVGHSFAFKKYGAAANNITEWDVWTNSNVTGNYQTILEEVPTYFNDFIPRGLFYDLIDNNTNEPLFDNVGSFTMADIYNALMKGTIPTSPAYSIQQFRERWEQLHPDVNNELLFNRYNIQ